MISFLVLAIITYLIGVFARLHILYNLAYFFLALHLIFKFYHYNIKKKLAIKHLLTEKHIFYNETSICQIEIQNRSRLPILYLEVEENLPVKLSPAIEKWLFTLAPGEKQQRQIVLKGRRRGFYQIGRLEWKSGDIIGYQQSKGILKKLELVVFPQIYSLEELGLPSRLAFGNIHWPQPIYKDPYQINGVREYSSGDSFKKIHWKATARTGQIQVRENPSTVSVEAGIFLNLSQTDYTLKGLERRTELAISTAASIAYYLNKIGQSFSLITNGLSPYASEQEKVSHGLGSGEAHLQEILESLASIQLTDKDDFLDLFTGKLDLSYGSVILIISSKDTEELIHFSQGLIKRGYSVKIFVFEERVEHQQFLGRGQTAPLSIYQINRKEDLYGIS